MPKRFSLIFITLCGVDCGIDGVEWSGWEAEVPVEEVGKVSGLIRRHIIAGPHVAGTRTHAIWVPSRGGGAGGGLQSL